MGAEKPVEVAPGPLLDEIAPEIDDLRRRRRRLDAGEPLADHEGDGVFDRRVRPVGDVLVFSRRDGSRSSSMAERLSATPDMRREPIASTRACSTASKTARAACASGRFRAMDAGVVAGEPERHQIGMAAHDDQDVLHG